VRLAAELGYLRVPEGTILPLEEVAALPPHRQVILSTGSQGEPNSALALMAAGEHKHFQVGEGDLVILSARVIPGHERTITRVVNQLLRLGAEVLWEGVAFVHVSGHASRDELRLMLSLVRPRFFVPVHGEYRHLLGHARLAREVGLPAEHAFVIEDGQGLELTKGGARLLERVPLARVLVDGKGVGDVGAVVLRDRELLAEDGMVVVAVTVDRATGAVVAGPELASRGWVYEREAEGVLEDAKAAVREALAEQASEAPLGREALAGLLRGTLRRFISQRHDRKPIVLPLVLEV
jgi:ribonuclease J